MDNRGSLFCLPIFTSFSAILSSHITTTDTLFLIIRAGVNNAGDYGSLRVEGSEEEVMGRWTDDGMRNRKEQKTERIRVVGTNGVGVLILLGLPSHPWM